MEHLLWIPNMTQEAVMILINSADHQNIPKAVASLQSIVSISKLLSDQLKPTQQKSTHMLTLLDITLQLLMEPFTDVNMTFTGQIQSLSTYAHLSFTMFWLHGTSFFSNQLYADSQMMIKNTFFCLAKQQILDPTHGFYLSQLGHDQ